MGACHCTSDGQEHKIIWRAGPERERIFHLRVTACREQGSHCCYERLAWVASRYGGRGLRAPAHSSQKSWERTTTELTTFMCTGQEVTFEPTSNAHARVDYLVSVVLHRPDNNKTKSSCLSSTLDLGTTVPIAIRVMFTHKFVIMYMCCVGATDALLHNTKQLLKCAMTK